MAEIQTLEISPLEQLPGWRIIAIVANGGPPTLGALAPDHDRTGIMVCAEDEAQLIGRVRAVVRVIEIAACAIGLAREQDLFGEVPVAFRAPGKLLPSTPIGGFPWKSVDAKKGLDGLNEAFAESKKHDAELAERQKEALKAAVAQVTVAQVTRPTEPAPSPTSENRERAKAKGFSGDACSKCGSLNMVRDGKCLTCKDCGSTDGGCA